MTLGRPRRAVRVPRGTSGRTAMRATTTAATATTPPATGSRAERFRPSTASAARAAQASLPWPEDLRGAGVDMSPGAAPRPRCSAVGCSAVGCSAQPAQGGHDHQQGRHHQAHHAEEHPVPAEHLRHDAGGEGSHQRGNHPGRGKRGEDLRVQHGRIDPGDHHIQRHGHGAAAQALDQPARHEGRHGPTLFRRSAGPAQTWPRTRTAAPPGRAGRTSCRRPPCR